MSRTQTINPAMVRGLGGVDPYTLNRVIDTYRDCIEHCKITFNAIEKMIARLRVFSEAELKTAIQNFASDFYLAKSYGKRGIRWFFYSDDRIESFIKQSNYVSIEDLKAEIQRDAARS